MLGFPLNDYLIQSGPVLTGESKGACIKISHKNQWLEHSPEMWETSLQILSPPPHIRYREELNPSLQHPG